MEKIIKSSTLEAFEGCLSRGDTAGEVPPAKGPGQCPKNNGDFLG